MLVEHLTAHWFRNLQAVTITSQARVIVLQGQNAQGKTNILEALYLCATGRSFRHAPARDMLAHGHAAGSVEALLQRQQVRHAVTVKLQPQHRAVQVDGRGLRQATALLQLLNMVAFFPDDLTIAKGSPESRRRFIDRAVANSEPPFVTAALGYQRALRSRNALLRAARAPDLALIATYDAQLVAFGATMQHSRQATLAQLTPLAKAHFRAMMPAGIDLEIHLHSGVAAPDADFEAGFAAALRANYPRDRARGLTSTGPHRADLACLVAGRDMRAFASQGQQRAVVLALKLAEVVYLAGKLGTPPILLLDDVSSELDADRTARLFAVVDQAGCQVWLTTTGATALPLPQDSQKVTVHQGTVSGPGCG